MNNNKNFGCADIPMMCSLFLEPALKVYQKYLPTISPEIQEYIHEWNKAMPGVIKSPKFQNCLGDYGKKVLHSISLFPHYTEKCIKLGKDTRIQSLQYALRFSYACNFLTQTVPSTQNQSFIDYGCGLSPLCASIQTTQNLHNAYCIDANPQICEIYDQIANTVGGHSPNVSTPIIGKSPCSTWKKNLEFITNNKIDSLIAVGVLQYINFEEQCLMFHFFERHTKNFFLEIKYQAPNITKHTDVTQYNISAIPSIYFTQDNFASSKFDTPNANILKAISETTYKYFKSFIGAISSDNINYLRHIRSAFINSKYLADSSR